MIQKTQVTKEETNYTVLNEKNSIKKRRELPSWFSSNSLTSIHEHAGSTPGLLSGYYHDLWRYRSQMQLGSPMAMAVVQASSCSSNSTPSLGTSCAVGAALKKKKKKRKKEKKENEKTAKTMHKDIANYVSYGGGCQGIKPTTQQQPKLLQLTMPDPQPAAPQGNSCKPCF